MGGDTRTGSIPVTSIKNYKGTFLGAVFIFTMYKSHNKNLISNLILASASPRRKELLSKAGFSFDVYIPKGEELNIIGKDFNEDLLKLCVKKKAEHAYNELAATSSDLYNKVSPSNLTIITCDTVVVNDNKIIGKPKDEKDAINILLSLSNKKHFVSSAVCVYKDGKYNIGLEKTFVTFRDITLKEIETYIKNNKPFDKAGSYGIQDEGFDFVKEIDGNIDNVIGLPLNTLKTLL